MAGCDYSGVSAGALTAVLSACGVDPLRAVDLADALSRDTGVYERGSLAGVWGGLIDAWLLQLLPEEAGRVCDGRVTLITLALWPPPSRHLKLHRFASRDDVVAACRASIHVPFFLDGKAAYRHAGRLCVDGSIAAARDIVAVSPNRELTLLLDHNDDPRIGGRRRTGDFLALRTRAGLDAMVEQGAGHMRAQLAAGHLAAWLDAAAAAAERRTQGDGEHRLAC